MHVPLKNDIASLTEERHFGSISVHFFICFSNWFKKWQVNVYVKFISFCLDIPVPNPVNLSTEPLKRAHEIADAAVVFEIPISPSISKSQLLGTESNPNCIADIVSSMSIAFSEVKSSQCIIEMALHSRWQRLQ